MVRTFYGKSSMMRSRFEGHTALNGNTYPFKDQLKAIGCKWHDGQRRWYCPNDRLSEAKTIISAAIAAIAA
jgi:hypothetical protein